jgi:hypothetical protein
MHLEPEEAEMRPSLEFLIAYLVRAANRRIKMLNSTTNITPRLTT